MSWRSVAYAALKFSNDYRAGSRAVQTRSLRPITNRIGRRLYGKVTGRLAARLFR